ncbi:CAP domain-containing protein [Aquibacillus koreensis]|uniref:CAP domain-containing protein n=1 Tax=Aquibacillus koreensis TaxID=279446 RepID=A0A9X3WHF3_9BACI|nr:CAP domain-containing protein [Aquibacillus koreensis]MCT2536643.1 CAP domain-containing protein [Aquibacillus koreensis]MDC3419982.1 CAP domain-containing protein [Aquibacillus koreensis]
MKRYFILFIIITFIAGCGKSSETSTDIKTISDMAEKRSILIAKGFDVALFQDDVVEIDDEVSDAPEPKEIEQEEKKITTASNDDDSLEKVVVETPVKEPVSPKKEDKPKEPVNETNESKDQDKDSDQANQEPKTTETELTEEVEKAEPAKEKSHQVNAFEQKVVALTNKEREKHGLAALKIDMALSKVSRLKSEDMQQNNYFSHDSPTYGSPFDMMNQFGISYRVAAENIAYGQTTPEQVVTAWMNSEGHRKNILRENITHIGVGYVATGHYWTQQFIGK